MSKIYSVVFRDGGKSYYFQSLGREFEKNDYVIVETEKGTQLGKINNQIESDDTSNYKTILRKASEEDLNNHYNNLKEASIALKRARKIAEELNLNMSIIDANFTFDRNQLLFNFIADERVDFRELAKRLANLYRTRIELRQIGARDKAKEVCGLASCGRTLCCSTFLNHMDSVTMNMAKNQNIALNPSKINGVCGRLKCCLTYEDDEYSKCHKGMPSIGEKVQTKEGVGEVISMDILNRKFKVDLGTERIEIDLDKNEKNKK